MGKDLAVQQQEQSPRLPASLARLIADNEFDDVGWLKPTRSQCVAAQPQIGPAIANLQASLEPASDRAMTLCLASLAVVCAPRQGEDAGTWKGRAHEYKRLLGEYPADIWRQACDEWAKTPDKGRWYPTVSELAEVMGRLLSRRKRAIQRLREMQTMANTHPTAVEPKGKTWGEMTPMERRAHEQLMASFRGHVSATATAMSAPLAVDDPECPKRKPAREIKPLHVPRTWDERWAAVGGAPEETLTER